MSTIRNLLSVPACLAWWSRSIREYRTDTIVFTIEHESAHVVPLPLQSSSGNNNLLSTPSHDWTQVWRFQRWVDIYIRIGIMGKRSVRYCDIIVYHQSGTNERQFEVRGLFVAINLTGRAERTELHYSHNVRKRIYIGDTAGIFSPTTNCH